MKLKNKKILLNILLGILISTTSVGCSKKEEEQNYTIEQLLENINTNKTKLDEALLHNNLIKKYNELSEYIKYSEIIQNYLLSNNFEVEEKICRDCSIDNYAAKFTLPAGSYYKYEDSNKDYGLKEIEKIVNDLNKGIKVEPNELVNALISCNKKINQGIELDNKVRSAIIDAAFSDIDEADYTRRDLKWNFDFDYYESLAQDKKIDGVVYHSTYTSPEEAFCDINKIDDSCSIDGNYLYNLCIDNCNYHVPECDCVSDNSYYNEKYNNYLKNRINETTEYANKIYKKRIK